MQKPLTSKKSSPALPLEEQLKPVAEDAVPEFVKDAAPEIEVNSKNDSLITDLQIQLKELQSKVSQQSSIVQDQEIRSSIETPKNEIADVAVDRQPVAPKRLTQPGHIAQTECFVQRESNPTDAMARYRSTIQELLVALSTIAGATARPSDELSAIAQNAFNRHSKVLK